MALYDFQASEQHAKSCSFFAYMPFACSQWFPRCINATDGTSGAQIEGICQDFCLQAADIKDCSDYFNVQTFCSDAQRFSPQPTCIGSDQLAQPASVTDSKWWKIGLGVGIAVVIIIALVLLWRRHKRENVTESELAKHDADKAAKLQKKKAKEEAKNGDRKANTSGPQLGRGRYEAPPVDSPQNGDAAVRMRDIEMGLEGANRPASAGAAASASSPRRRGGASPDPPSDGTLSGASSSPPLSGGGAAIMSPPANRRSLIAEQAASPKGSKSHKEGEKHHKHKKAHKSDKKAHRSEKKAAAAHLDQHGELSPIARPPFGEPDQPGTIAGGHVQYGQPAPEDAWKSGQPTRVAPPEH